jgi:hypothetical protein
MAAVLWVLFKLNGVALYWICVAAATLTGISGLIYIFAGMRLLAKHPSSSAAKKADANSANFHE